MSHWIRHFSTYKQAEELFSLLNARISELGIEQAVDVESYISYRDVLSTKVFMYVVPRQKWLRITLEIPLAEIKDTTGLAKLNEDRTWKPPRIYSQFNFESVDQIEKIASVIKEAHDHNSKKSSPGPRVNKGEMYVNEDRLRKIIREETANLAEKEEISSIVTNAVEPLVNKIDEFANRLDQSDEMRDRLISLSERMMTLYEQVASENRQLRESIRAVEQRVAELENRAA